MRPHCAIISTWASQFAIFNIHWAQAIIFSIFTERTHFIIPIQTRKIWYQENTISCNGTAGSEKKHMDEEKDLIGAKNYIRASGKNMALASCTWYILYWQERVLWYPLAEDWINLDTETCFELNFYYRSGTVLKNDTVLARTWKVPQYTKNHRVVFFRFHRSWEWSSISPYFLPIENLHSCHL